MQCKVKLHKSLTKLILHNILKMEKKSLVECRKLAKNGTEQKISPAALFGGSLATLFQVHLGEARALTHCASTVCPYLAS